MFKHYWWRFIKFPGYFTSHTGLSGFGDKCQTMLVHEVNDGTEKIYRRRGVNKQRIEEIGHELEDLANYPKLGDDRFQRVQSSLRLFNFAFWILVLSEFGLNYFTTYIIFDSSKTGLFWLVMRLAISLTITGMAIIGAELLLEAAFPHEIHDVNRLDDNPETKVTKTEGRRDIGKIILFGAIFLMAEAVIYYVGLSRAHTFESGGVGSEIAVAMVLLSMVIPIAAGAVRWQRGKELDAYKNRLQEKKLIKDDGGLRKAIADLDEQEANLFKDKVNNYWTVFKDFEGFKEKYNRKHQIEEKYKENPECSYLKGFDAFQEEGRRRCAKAQKGDSKIASSVAAGVGKLN